MAAEWACAGRAAFGRRLKAGLLLLRRAARLEAVGEGLDLDRGGGLGNGALGLEAGEEAGALVGDGLEDGGDVFLDLRWGRRRGRKGAREELGRGWSSRHGSRGQGLGGRVCAAPEAARGGVHCTHEVF